MGEIATTREDIAALTGVHLFHFRQSNCSQRVRLVLEEKGVAWTGHHVNLTADEHLAPEFTALNPKGVVPVLVHDGRTYTESNDIIAYIDATFPASPLVPADPHDAAFVTETLQTSSAVQGALKLLSHEFLFKPVRRMNSKQLAEFARSHPDPELIKFMEDYSSNEGFGDARIRAAAQTMLAALADLDQRLQSRPWLSGNTCGLADISWIVNVHRMMLMRLPISQFTALADWYRRILARPSFKKAVRAFEPKPELAFFATYSVMRAAAGTGARSYCG